MVTCTHVAGRAARTKEHLVVDSPGKWDQSVAYYLRPSSLPRLLEELPVEWTRGRVESARVDEHLTACARTVRYRGGVSSEVRDEPFRAPIAVISGNLTS